MSDFCEISKKLGIRDNVCLRVIDIKTKKVVQQVIGHNAATSTMLAGIAHFLAGDGTLNQAKYTLKEFIPQYMSLGTMGLCSQEDDVDGAPTGIGNIDDPDTPADKLSTIEDYVSHTPGFGADGYSAEYNNGRSSFGLGPQCVNSTEYIPGELISPSLFRVPITYRRIIPETDSELPKSMDLILGGMVSVDILAPFMGNNEYVFITEAGLWNNKYSDGALADNGLLAGYRIAPNKQYDFESMTDSEIENMYADFQKEILRVNLGQVVEIIWKIQLGCIEDMYIVLPETSTSDSAIEDFAIGQNSLTTDVTQDLPTSSTVEIS